MATSTNELVIDNDGTHGVTIVRDFDHPVDAVYRAMTDPDLIGRWMGPHGYDTVDLTNDARHAGTWTLVHQGPDGDQYAFRGVFHGDPTPALTVRTFEWLGLPGHVSLETLRIDDLGDGRCRVHNDSVFLTTEDRDGMREQGMDQGVREGFERLDEVLESL